MTHLLPEWSLCHIHQDGDRQSSSPFCRSCVPKLRTADDLARQQPRSSGDLMKKVCEAGSWQSYTPSLTALAHPKQSILPKLFYKEIQNNNFLILSFLLHLLVDISSQRRSFSHLLGTADLLVIIIANTEGLLYARDCAECFSHLTSCNSDSNPTRQYNYAHCRVDMQKNIFPSHADCKWQAQRQPL